MWILKKIRKAVPLLLVVGAGIVLLASAPVASAQETPKDLACQGAGLGEGCAAPAGSPSVESTIKTAISILSIIVGLAAVVMIIIGGFKYITSGGDSAKVTSAKDTILYAIVGLVVAALAQIIVRFVLVKSSPSANADKNSIVRVV